MKFLIFQELHLTFESHEWVIGEVTYNDGLDQDAHRFRDIGIWKYCNKSESDASSNHINRCARLDFLGGSEFMRGSFYVENKLYLYFNLNTNQNF